MFIPCEGIGSAISAILKGTGLVLSSLEFSEDRAVAVFSNDKVKVADTGVKLSFARTKANRRPPADIPFGPWERLPHEEGKARDIIWKCGDKSLGTSDIARAFSIPTGTMMMRLKNTGYAVTKKRRGKLEKVTDSDRLTVQGLK